MRRMARSRGPIAWMASNSVAANLLMIVMIIGGLLMIRNIGQEFLPQTEPDSITVRVALPGATPAEVEQSILLALEDSMSGLQGIEQISATAAEGSGSLDIELNGARARELVYNDVRQAVDRISSFPEDAEDPVVSLSSRRRSVLSLYIYGDTTDYAIRMAAEHVRSILLQNDGLSQVEIDGAQDLVMHVEVPESSLREHALTMGDIATTIRRAAMDRGGGTIETSGGDLVLRFADRRETIEDFGNLAVIGGDAGAVVRLDDIATLRRGFDSTSTINTFEGKPAARIVVYRIGSETPISVSNAVRETLPQAMATLPAAIDSQILSDQADQFRGRMNLLIKNGLIGLALVLLLLSLFLEIRLAIWVALGIPTAFMGTLLLLPYTGSTINMVSMFAFLVALGIVVDDAIVAGENIYEYRQQGMNPLDAAINGARDIAVPLSFSILTNIVAFIPLALAPGFLGKIFFAIPIVVSLAFIMSWIEALFILPAHLAGGNGKPVKVYPPLSWIGKGLGTLERTLFHPVQQVFASGLASFTQLIYGPALRHALNWRYLTVAVATAIFMVTLAFVMSGRLGFGLFPPVPRDFSEAQITMPVGTPLAVTEQARDKVIAAAERVFADNGGDALRAGMEARIEDNSIRLRAHLTPVEVRPIGTEVFTAAWQREVGSLPEVKGMRFNSSWGGRGTSGVRIRLSHPDSAVLAVAAADLAAQMAEFSSVQNPDDGFTPGKEQLEFRINEVGRSLGLTASNVAEQVRAAFFGVEALSQQEGRNEVEVRVQRPPEGRRSEADLEQMAIRTPDGGLVPLFQVAEVARGRSDATITRENGQRVVSVTANVRPRSESNTVVAAVTGEILPRMIENYPGLSYSLAGRQETQRKVMQSFIGFSVPLALAIIFGLLAIPFRSYLQPAIIMLAIPFGFVGAVLGHMIMGYSLSIISVFGIIALSGVVINAGIVMIDYANKMRMRDVSAYDAIWQAGVRRFRPILLTTVTTFCGLAPMIFETERQAQFLIPMAISLGYGIVFATLIVLVLIPALYLVLEDLKTLVNPNRPGIRDGSLGLPATTAPGQVVSREA